MGRSVYVSWDAIGEFYLWEDDFADEELDGNDYERADEIREMVMDHIWLTAEGLAPSLRQPMKREMWRQEEERVLGLNKHGSLIFTQYGLVMAVYWVAPGGDWAAEYEGLSAHWAKEFMPRLAEKFPQRLRRIGGFSNGESVYKRVEEKVTT